MSTTQVLTFSPSLLAVQTTIVQISITDDSFVESTENFVGVLTLNTIDEAINLQPSETSISIIDNDGMLNALKCFISYNHNHIGCLLAYIISRIISTSQICHHIY